MSQTCNRCYRVVMQACQSDTEALECINLRPPERGEVEERAKRRQASGRQVNSVTTVDRDAGCVTYEVFVGGERKWVRTIFWNTSKRYRPGGPAFREASEEQARIANEFYKQENPNA